LSKSSHQAGSLFLSRVFKALSHPTRRAILRLLRDGPLNAGEIADHFDLSKPTLTGHFHALRDADLVDVQRRGTTMIYRLNASVLEEALLESLDAFGLTAPRRARSTEAKT